MAEYVEKLKDDVIYKFIVGTCQLLPKSYDAVSEPIYSHSEYAIQCGSTMEFYIRPLNSGINDIDALLLKGSELAFIEDFPVLPIDVSRLHDTITCFRIEPYHRYPGFVRLRKWGEMNYNWKYKKYEFNPRTDPGIIYIKFDKVANITARQLTRERFGAQPYTARGPAITIQHYQEHSPNDSVKGFWCPQWPKEAQSWPKRPRNHGWPTIDTISEVVQHGCHVVYVQHRDCRNDELQWRYSFSVAEVILLQSWTQIQQIVYHMLRFLSNRELKQNDCPKEDEVLCTYHLKTLMLWTCEEMSPEWWNSSSVIAICCELLEKLLVWLKQRYCPNYFIPEANLFHESFKSTMLDKTERQLNKFCKSGILRQWFLGNYIIPIIPINVIDRRTVDFSKSFQSITEYRKMFQLESLDLLFSEEFIFCNIYSRKSINSQTIQPRSNLSEMRALRTFRMLGDSRWSRLPMPADVSCFTYFDKTVLCLNTAYSLGYGEISWDGELFEYVRGIFLKHRIVRCQYHIFPESLTAQRSLLQFLRAQEMMENLTGANSPSEFQLLSVMSKEFLRKALECDDSQSSIIAPAALVYLAALHFATSEYQTVIDLCSAVLMDQTTQMENEALNAGCLLFIDDVAGIVGLFLLCKKFKAKKHFTGRQIYLDLRLTVKVFAYYLTMISAERISTQFELNHDLPTSAFSLDKFLLASASQCIDRRTDSVATNTNLNADPLIVTEKVIDSLLEYGLENMTSFYGVIRKDFGIQCNTADCYRALYLYKCRQYERVLLLCERILQESDLQSDLIRFAFANILMMPPFDSFFDSDIQSLVGLQTLFYFLSPLNDDLQKFKFAAHSFDQHGYCIPLMKHYTVTSYHFLGRHFLARYLKLRCCIECNDPCRNALAEFAAMKCHLPFEHIIRFFDSDIINFINN